MYIVSLAVLTLEVDLFRYDSLRACLTECANIGCNAFREAEAGMGQVRMNAKAVHSKVRYDPACAEGAYKDCLLTHYGRSVISSCFSRIKRPPRSILSILSTM
jgi:hypothetical protein